MSKSRALSLASSCYFISGFRCVMNIFCDFLVAKYGQSEEGPDFLTEVFLQKNVITTYCTKT